MPPLLAIALLSGASLAYEVLPIHLFSVVTWQHVAAMMISIALLGIGASGTALALWRQALIRHFTAIFPLAAALFGLAAPLAFALAERIPFNPLAVIWEGSQQLYLLAIYLVLAVPFFLTATAIGLALLSFRERIGAVYRADLLGAGCGSLGVIGLLYLLPAERALAVVGALGLAAAALATWRLGNRRAAALVLLTLALASPLLWPAAWLKLQPGPYRALSQALTVSGAHVVAKRHGPLGSLAVVASPQAPFRQAPGLSLTAPAAVPPQLGLFIDGGGPEAIMDTSGGPEALAFLDRQTAAVAYHLLDSPRVLVPLAGTGVEVLRATALGAGQVDAVEPNPQIAELLQSDLGGFVSRPFAPDEVHLHHAGLGAFVAANPGPWDLVQIVDLTAFAAGADAKGAITLLTVEGLTRLIDRLSDDGLVSVTLVLRLPPRASVKLLATAQAALTGLGTKAPGNHVAALRSWDTVTLLIKRTEFQPRDIEDLRAFSEARGFDLAWYPGMVPESANRYHVLERAYLFEAARALFAGDPEGYLARYKFHIDPPTDDRPFFFRFFTWGLAAELTGGATAGTAVWLDGGYLVLFATLVQALLASLLVIMLPLLIARRGVHGGTGAASPPRVIVYFVAIGFGFIFIEIAFIGRLTLFIGHPLAAVALVLAGFLVFAGLGSGASGRLAARYPSRALAMAAAGVALLTALAVGFLALQLPALASLPIHGRTLVALALIAPLAFLMGMPFPLGLGLVSEAAPGLAPWAWGVNGCASVVGAVLASLLALHIGFSGLLWAAIALYLAAGLTLSGRSAVAAPVPHSPESV